MHIQRLPDKCSKNADNLVLQTILRGKSALLCACLGGALWSLAFAPFFILPAAYLSFALPCLWVAYDLPKTKKVSRVFRLLFAWAFCANVSSLYWVAYAVYLSFGQSIGGASLGLVMMIVLCTYLSVYTLGALLAHRLLLRAYPTENACGRIGLFVCTFALAETLRSVLFGGFPWNLAGYAWNSSIFLLQTNALGGINLTSLLTLCSYAFAAAAAYLLFARRTRNACLCAIMSIAIPASAAAFGAWRLAAAPPMEKNSPIVRIVQPNIQQHKKWREQDAIDNFRRTIDLSIRKRAHSISLLLWPETAFPYRLKTDDDARGQLLIHPWMPQLLAIVPRWMVFGAVRESKKQQRPKTYKNSLVMIDNLGRVQGLYDKVKLVPLGEFIPFSRHLLGLGMRTLTNFPSFESGKKNNTLHPNPSLALRVQICYEAIFPELMPFVLRRKNFTDEQADLLFNATNDGWFGHSSGPYQHLEMARIRAVETGTPLFRAANTGISAVFDAFGREIARLPLDSQGWIDAPLPPKTQQLLFVQRNGNTLFWMLWLSICISLVALHKKF